MLENQNTLQNQFGFSFLRILATFSVIIIHVSAHLVEDFGKISMFDWNVANFFDSISRYSVPMFFMISGALLLGKDYMLMDFLKKRLGKILPPFFIWSLIYSFLKRYAFKDESFNCVKIVKDVFYGSEYHLWFIYSLLGIYLTVPILRRWIKYAPQKEIQFFLIIWLFTLLLTIPNFKIYFPKIDLIYFSGFIGYFILGYYLSLFKFKKFISVLLIAFGVAITILGTYYFTIKNSKLYYYFYEYLCLNALMVSSGMFMLFNKMVSSNKKVNVIVKQLNQACFGIYLMHPLVLKLLQSIGLDAGMTTPVISILLVGFSCFLICFTIIYYLKKLRYSELILA